VIYRRDWWDSLEQVEFETIRWVAWLNDAQVNEALGEIPPAEYETNHYRQDAPTEATGVTLRALRHTRSGSTPAAP